MNWLEQQIKNNPQKSFIQDDMNSYTYMDVFEMVQVYSRYLLQLGIKSHDRVLIYLSNSIELVEIILSCFEIGAIVVPVSRYLTKNELHHILKKINPTIIITNWEGQESFSNESCLVACIEELPSSSSGCSVLKNEYEKKSENVCAIMLTSGTTSIPKAVQLTYGNFETSCSNWNSFLEFDLDDQFLCCLPLNHIGGLAVLIRALIYGFSVNLLSNFDASTVNKVISRHPISIISLVPTMLKRILAIEGGLESLKSLRHILLGGGPSPEVLLDYCIQEKLPIIKVYGMTETCSGTFGLKVLDEPQNKLFAGRPFPETKAWIKNGEIHISGPMIMAGYLGEDEAQGVHNSHDLGYVGDDHLIFLNVRRKDLIVSGGENINPIEVEEQLLNVNGIMDSAVIGKNDEEWGQKVIAYIVCESDSINGEYLDEKLKKSLSKFKIPKEYVRVPLIPRNELGKIVYEKLKLL